MIPFYGLTALQLTSGQIVARARSAFAGLGGELLRRVVLPYVVQRLVLGGVGVFAMQLIPMKRGFHALPHLAGLDVWVRWDSEYYIAIAERAYALAADGASPRAFFPLYPGLCAALGAILPVSLPVTAWLVANLAAVAALSLLYVLVRDSDDVDTAERTVLVALAFPTSYYLSSVYAESTYLALAIGAVLAVSSRRPGIAAILIFFACLTRPQGFLCLTIPFAVGWLARGRRRAELPWFALAAGAALAVLLLVYRIGTGDPLAFLHAPTVQSLGVFSGPRSQAPSVFAVLLDEGLGANLMRRLLNWSALGLVVAACVHLFRRKEVELALLSLLAFAVPLSFHATIFDAASMARYALLAFPVFIVLARWTGTRGRGWCLQAGFLALQTLLFAFFACWYWVE